MLIKRAPKHPSDALPNAVPNRSVHSVFANATIQFVSVHEIFLGELLAEKDPQNGRKYAFRQFPAL